MYDNRLKQEKCMGLTDLKKELVYVTVCDFEYCPFSHIFFFVVSSISIYKSLLKNIASVMQEVIIQLLFYAIMTLFFG